MVRSRGRTTNRCSWSEDNMKQAIKAVKKHKMPLSTAAKTFHVPRNTLRRRVETDENMKKFGQHTTLTADTETNLVQYLLKMDSIGYGLTFRDLQSLAYRFVFVNGLKHPFNNETQMAGADWLRAFLSRHTILSKRIAEQLSYARAKGLTREHVNTFYDTLENVMSSLDLMDQPGKIFNCDETGLQLIYKPKKVISRRGKRDVICQTTGEKGETVSVMVCGSASGYILPPFIIMKGKRFKPEFDVGMPPGAKVVLSESGYMKWEQFSLFIDHFIQLKPPGDVILILDGHGSHCSDPPTLEKAVQNNIHIICLPPHTTHRLQPLDVAFFKPLKAYYNEACRKFVRTYPGKPINKSVFGEILSEAWSLSATMGNIIKGFKACGIFPLDRNAIPDHTFLPSTVHASNEDLITPDTSAITEGGGHQITQENTSVGQSTNQNTQVYTSPADKMNQTSQNEAQNKENNLIISEDDQLLTPKPLQGFESLSPIPRRQASQRRANENKCKVLTDPDFIEKLKKKRMSLQTKKEKIHNNEKEKRTTKKNIKGKGRQRKTTCCGNCSGFYKTYEDWVQCLTCKMWFHEYCVMNADDPYFQCKNCSSDIGN